MPAVGLPGGQLRRRGTDMVNPLKNVQVDVLHTCKNGNHWENIIIRGVCPACEKGLADFPA